MTGSPKPIVLLLGEVLHATKEWDELAGIAELRVSFLQLVLPTDSALTFPSSVTKESLTLPIAAQPWQQKAIPEKLPLRGLSWPSGHLPHIRLRRGTSADIAARAAAAGMPSEATDIDDHLDSSLAALIKS